MVKATHRSTVLSLLPFDPGEVQQELIATLTGAKVYYYSLKQKDILNKKNYRLSYLYSL